MLDAGRGIRSRSRTQQDATDAKDAPDASCCYSPFTTLLFSSGGSRYIPQWRSYTLPMPIAFARCASLDFWDSDPNARDVIDLQTEVSNG